ncbi:hypothetical protein BaRGS_00024301 [Batillaria attramentaria]|uniref:Secreted protein n=1 Tax=Batillaria attramentaria TaxID=370345 RepID=A0ABD0KBT4_9CAEN
MLQLSLLFYFLCGRLLGLRGAVADIALLRTNAVSRASHIDCYQLVHIACLRSLHPLTLESPNCKHPDSRARDDEFCWGGILYIDYTSLLSETRSGESMCVCVSGPKFAKRSSIRM